MKKFATIVSYVFDGSYISIPVYIVICLTILDSWIASIGWALLCILFATIIPFLYIFILFRKKKIYDLHLPNRENRIRPLIVALISYIMGFFILYVLEAPLFLKGIFAVSIVNGLILTTITYFWKISFHTSWITVIAITFYILFGYWMLLLLLLIPFIGWARVTIKRHTIMQVILGSVISAIGTTFIYSRYGFLYLNL
ncbi:MAG: hypothetical protein U5N58_12385 [Actinomycetota bacterium]|nr:hypothetical protein [Actinomycetota bacterium]